MPTCESCNSPASESARFCGRCGHSLARVPVPVLSSADTVPLPAVIPAPRSLPQPSAPAPLIPHRVARPELSASSHPQAAAYEQVLQGFFASNLEQPLLEERDSESRSIGSPPTSGPSGLLDSPLATVRERVEGAKIAIQGWRTGGNDRQARLGAAALGAELFVGQLVVCGVLAVFVMHGLHAAGTGVLLRAGVWLAGLAMAGTLSVSAAAGGEDAAGRVTLSGHMLPWGMTLVSLAAAYYLSVRSERDRPSSSALQAFTRSALLAGTYAIAAAIASNFATWNTDAAGLARAFPKTGAVDLDGGQFVVGVPIFRLAVASFLMLAIVGTAGRFAALHRASLLLDTPVPSRITAWVTPFRTAITMLGVGIAFLGALSLVAVIVEVARGDLSPQEIAVSPLIALQAAVLAFFLGAFNNLGLHIGADLQGSSFIDAHLSDGHTRAFGLLHGGLPSAAWLLVVPVLVAALVAGALQGMRTHPEEDDRAGSDWWRFGVASAMIWLVVGGLSTMSLKAGGGADFGVLSVGAAGQVSVGFSLLGLAMTGFLFGALSRALSGQSARYLAGLLPLTTGTVAARLRILTPLWAVLTLEARGRLGRPAPAWLVVQAAQAQLPPNPLVRLPVHRGLASALGAALLILVALALTLTFA